MTFIDKVVKGLESLDNIDIYIECWHVSSDSIDIPLYEYLGMTEIEYQKWILDDDFLQEVINIRKANLDLEIVKAI